MVPRFTSPTLQLGRLVAVLSTPNLLREVVCDVEKVCGGVRVVVGCRAQGRVDWVYLGSSVT
jgi:hypothetical protein